MYAAIWRWLPGPTPVKALLALLILAACLFVLFSWVFPWIEAGLPFGNVTVNSLGPRWAAPTAQAG